MLELLKRGSFKNLLSFLKLFLNILLRKMAEKETSLEKIQRLIANQKNIRNVATSAHIHHGKCISGNSRIILSNCTIKRADNVFEEVSANGRIYEENEEHIVYIPKEKIEVLSLNKLDGKIEKKPIQYVWKLKGGNTIKIRLKNGFEITTTPEHKFVVFKDGFVNVKASDLKYEDKVVCAKNADFFWEENDADKNQYDYIEVNSSKKQKMLQVLKNTYPDLAFVEITKIESGFEEVVYDFTIPENHNFIAEGMVIHNTAFTDNLLAAAGMMAKKSAGDLEAGMMTWQHADEQERLITVDAANVSMAHRYQDEEYLINLIDTPGHVDFSGNVTRAMRAIDGTFVLVCGVEGIMPQTETVLKQALRERVKPVLFINKIDRMIKELKLTPESMQERLLKIIESFNHLIMQIAEPEYKEKWKVNVKDGSVAFGSARDNWALSVPFMEKRGVSFKDIIQLYDMEEEERRKWVWQNAPLHEVVLDMAVKHLPNPLEAQKYRIPKIWKGDTETKFGKDVLNCNKEGEVAFVITKIVIDPRTGKEIAAGRLYSGTIVNGMEVYANNAKKSARIQQVLVYNGIKPEQLESVPAGNVLAISGLNVDVGDTITVNEQTPFEEIKHIFQPVITKSVEVLRPADLPKLIEVLRKVAKEDPSIKVEINEETGENLISGMGELHLEIIEGRIKNEKGLEVKTGHPIVVYRESIVKSSSKVEVRTPNGHNIFVFSIAPLEDEIYNTIERGEIPEERLKKRAEQTWKKLSEFGMSNEEARQIKEIYKGNVFEDRTRGIVLIGEIIDSIMDGWKLVVDAGPLAKEPLMKSKTILWDAKIHVDHMHRGPAQIYPAVRRGMFESMQGNAAILEPIQTHRIEGPISFMGALTQLIGSKRGVLIDVQQDGVEVVITAKIPVAEMIGWSNDLRSASEGRGVSSLVDQEFQKLPRELQDNVIRKIRERKGLSENQ